MVTTKVDAALDTLAQYREEGVVLQSALDDLRAQPAALDRLIARLDSSRPDALVEGFVALRQHFAHTRAQIDVAVGQQVVDARVGAAAVLVGDRPQARLLDVADRHEVGLG